MRFLHPEDYNKEITYDDVFLVPNYSEVASRMDVDLTPTDPVGTTIPIVVCNMTAMAGKRMAETVARRGGLVILPQDISMERLRIIIPYIKACHPVFETPVILEESKSIQQALNLINKRSHGAVMVVDEQKKPVGIFTEKDAYRRDRFLQVRDVMSKELLTMQDTASPQQIFEAIKEKRVPVIPIIKNTGELAGVLTAKGCMRATIYTPAQNAQRQLLTAVAVGVNAQTKDKVRKLVELGVDVIVLDMAHGYQKKMIETIKGVREVIGPDRILVAGNVVTAEATRDFIHAGVNIVKVGVGPGAMCTTRMMTGMGRPQFSAVRACSEVARSMGAHVWADGNIKQPRDVSLALAAGASCAFFGSWFTGTYESPADIKRDEQGRLYKENFGMASRRAVIDRTRSYEVFDQERKQYFEEGISASKMYLKPGEESAEDIIDKITAGVRSACTYAGARNLEEFYEKVVVGTQTQAGFIEGKPWEESW